MDALKENIYTTLKQLGDEEYKVFKWFLQQGENLEGLQPIPKCELETAERTATTDLITQTYPSKGFQIVINVLRKIKKMDLLEKFEKGS